MTSLEYVDVVWSLFYYSISVSLFYNSWFVVEYAKIMSMSISWLQVPIAFSLFCLETGERKRKEGKMIKKEKIE